VELYDHRGKRELASFAEALAEARAFLHATLTGRADALGLKDTAYALHEEVLEDYADFSRRSRKELVIARLEAILTGMPE
jgi:hypothetical protein